MDAPRRRPVALALVLAAHGLFLWMPTGPGVPRTSPTPQALQPPLQVRLLDLSGWRPATGQQAPQPVVARAPRPVPTGQPGGQPIHQPVRQPINPPPVLAQPDPSSAPTPAPDAQAAGGVQPHVNAPAAASTAVQPRLDLTLPLSASAPWRQRHPAVNAQIGSHAPPTVESRIADAAGASGPWTQERIDNDRVLMRRGNTCFTLSRSRAAQIDPMGASSQRSPWLASQPFSC